MLSLKARRPGVLAIAIATLAASDVAYRLLLRAPLRRALGMVGEHQPLRCVGGASDDAVRRV